MGRSNQRRGGPSRATLGLMGDPARKRATYQDLLDVPGHLVAEIIDGEVITSPRPAPRHARATSALGAALWGPFDGGVGGPGGWWIFIEPELHLGSGEVVVPDLAGWRTERMPELPDTAYFGLAPDWVCEILSASTEAVDRADKMPIYASAGVGHVWLLDPILETLEVYRLDAGQWTLLRTMKGSCKARVEPFDAVEIDLAPLWRRRVGV